MPWSGSNFFRTNGTYSGAIVWQDDAGAGTNIVANNHDTHDEDIADGIDACINKNGANTPTVNLSMGGFKHTGVANATARDQYLATGQFQDATTTFGGTSSGAANTYVFNVSPALPAYADGAVFRFLSHQANSGAATLNINSLGAKAIVTPDGTALAGGEIANAAFIMVGYRADTDKFALIGLSPTTVSSLTVGTLTVTTAANLANTALRILDSNATHYLIVQPTSNLTADRTLSVTTGDASRTLSMSGNIVVGGTLTTASAVTFSGASAFTATLTGVTTVTFPTTGTLATLGGIETFSGAKTFSTAINLTAGQLTFPATAVPSANVNTLDDYEEGNATSSWTPGISFGGGTTGITYTDRNGMYIKIGRLVQAWFWVLLSSKGSSTGSARITGLPFTSINSSNNLGGGVITRWDTLTSTAIPTLMLWVETNTTTVKIVRSAIGAETSSPDFTDAGFANTTQLWGCVSYLADS